MKSDNVVRPDFGRSKAPAAASEKTPIRAGLAEMFDELPDASRLTLEQCARAEQDLLYLLINQEFARAMRDKLQLAGDTIFSLGGFVVDKESIELRREGLRSLSLEDILAAIAVTDELQWSAQPSYIGALTLEHHARLQLAKAVMPQKSEK